MYEENLDALLAYAQHRTTFASGMESGAAYEQGSRIVAMATCSYEFDDARYVVIGVISGTL
jgi:sortase B